MYDSTSDIVMVNGRLMTMADARVQVNRHDRHYASSVFEGIRSYEAGVWRLRDHMERLLRSCAAYRLDIPYSVDDLCQMTMDTLRANNRTVAYIRPHVGRGINPATGSGLKVFPKGVAIDTHIMTESWSGYVPLDEETKSATVLVTNWERPPKAVAPGQAKGASLYAFGTLARLEAEDVGAHEALLIGRDPADHENRYVLDGSGQNLAIVVDGCLITPNPERWNILGGLTLDLFLNQLSWDDVTPWRYGNITIDQLLRADEVMLFGTASEICPVGRIKRWVGTALYETKIRDGYPGPIYRRLREQFDRIVGGKNQAYAHLLTPHKQTVGAS